MNDGFFQLKPRKIPEEKPKQKKKVKPPKFKKGGWKHWLYKKLRKWRSSPYVEQFHFEKRKNILITLKKNADVQIFSRKLNRATLKELKKLSASEAYVLIDSYDDTYTKFSIKTYLKLMGIDRMIISFRLQANNDDIEIVDVYEREDYIDNINDLAHFINYHRQGIDGVYEIQSNCCCFTYYDYIMKIVVMKTDGSVETYKGDMNNFMKAYDIRPF